MKYLKSFNEELKPESYIRAGRKLQDLGKISRGIKLTDYGTEKLHGHYNVHLGNLNSSTRIFTGEFTQLRCQFYYGTPHWNGPQTNVNSTLIKTLDEEDLLRNWTEGRETLSFTLEFDMLPTATTVVNLKKADRADKASSRKPLFCMIVSLSYWQDGLREWNYLEDANEYVYPGDEQYMGVTDLYKNTREVRIELNPLMTKGDVGVFADRKSALKFKKKLPDLINPMRSQIMDILSTVGGSTDDLENILEKIYSISINYIYQDDVNSNNNGKNWYYKSF